MKIRTLFCLLAMLVITSLGFAQSTVPNNEPSSPQAGGDRQLPGGDVEAKTSTREDVKTTESQIKDLKKKLEKLEKEFNKKKTKLEERIATEKDEKKLAKLKSELEKLEKKFKNEKEKTEGTLARLERFPIESQTRNNGASLLPPGNCGNVLDWDRFDPRRLLLENLGAANLSHCYEHQSRPMNLLFTDAGPALSLSACFKPMRSGSSTGEYIFMAPGLTVMEFCNVQGANCRVFVFVERMPIFNTIVFAPSARDSSLVSVCPRSGQAEWPAHDHWEQLMIDASLGTTDYDSIIRGMALSAGGIHPERLGMGGLKNLVESSKQDDKLALRNVVLDNKLPDLIKNIESPWIEIDSAFTPFLDPAMRELAFLRRVGGRVGVILNKGIGPDSLENLKTLIADIEKSEYKPKDLALYSKNLEDAERFLQEGKNKEAKKALEDFATKFLEKESKRIMKQYGKSITAREKVRDIMDQWEFLAAASDMSAFVKTHPDKQKQKELMPLVEKYKIAAKPLQDWIEKLKVRLTYDLKEGELLEPIVVKPGESIIFLISVVGTDYDYKTQKPRLRAVVDEKFAPADETGAVPKDSQAYKNATAGIVSFEELASRGFTTVVVETKNGRSIVSAAKKGKFFLSLGSFADREGVTTEEVGIMEMKERSGLNWIPIMLPAGISQRAMPKDPNQFLKTFTFLDRDSNRLTVMRFVFESERVLALRAKSTDERIELHYFLYPGGYESLLTMIDALKQNVKEREFSLPVVRFKVLPPDNKNKPEDNEKKD